MTLAFENGELIALAGEEKSREAVLALPLSRLLVKLVRVEGEGSDAAAPDKGGAAEAASPKGPEEVAGEALQAMNPFPDEPLSVSCEKITDGIYLAAALPEGTTDDLIEALNNAKVNVTRVDALVLGELRALWNELKPEGRQVVLLRSPETISLFVLDDGNPVAVRAIAPEGDLKREVMLSLLEAEDFGGPKDVREIVVRGDIPGSGRDIPGLDVPVREIAETGDLVQESLRGVRARTNEAGSLNALPASWAEVLGEERFKRKNTIGIGIAGGVWALIMAVLFAVPMVFGFMTDHQKGLFRSVKSQYDYAVSISNKLEIIRSCSDHHHGALEVLRALTQNIPPNANLQLSSFKFERGEEGKATIELSGEAQTPSDVYNFKNNLAAVEEVNGEDETNLVFSVGRVSPSLGKDGKQHFSLTLGYLDEKEEEDEDE